MAFDYDDTLYKFCMEQLENYDKSWIQRKRKIGTIDVFNALLSSTILKKGVSTCIVNNEVASHVALIKARNKIEKNVFKTMHQSIYDKELLKNNYYALDGSKFRVPYGFLKFGFNTRTMNKGGKRPAKRPIAMLSALTGINTDTIVNYSVTTHFNERTVVEKLIENLDSKDVVILDRGYYSKKLFNLFHEKTIGCVMRVRKNANKTVKDFYSSRRRTLRSHLVVDDKIIPIKYIKYKVEDSLFVIATNLFDRTIKNIKAIYKMRWRVELSFKRLKTFLNLNHIKAKTVKHWKQEVDFRILLDTIIRRVQTLVQSKKSNKTLLIGKTKTLYSYILIRLQNVLFAQHINQEDHNFFVFN